MSQSKYFVAAISVDGVFSWALRRLCDDLSLSAVPLVWTGLKS